MRVRFWTRLGQLDGTAIAAFVLLAFCFFLGGASRQHELRLALVELAALPLLVMALPGVLITEQKRPSLLFLTIVAAIAAIPLIQLLPLPTAIWTNLPGRSELKLALEITGTPQGALPLSLTPDRTWRSFLALLPPMALLFGALGVGQPTRQRMIHLLIGGVVLGILFAAAQLAGGDRLYLWATTDSGSAAGFFANRNHMATLCLMALPFAIVIGARPPSQRGPDNRGLLWVSILFAAIALVAIAATQSRTGIALAGPTLGASLLAAWVASGRGRPRPALLGIVGGAAVACLAVAIFALNPLLDRFSTVTNQEGRFENWPVVAQAADRYLPLGSGLGSFDAVFRSVEPLDSLDSTFFNQAHNEYLETWLETGWLGMAVLAAFLIWFVRRSISAWRSRSSATRDLQRAATIAIVVVLAHSASDYPIRTVTIAAAFALCCAILELAARADEASEVFRRRRSSSGVASSDL